MDTEKIFRDMLDDIVKEEKYEDCSITISPTSSDGANFTTALYKAVILAPNKEDLHLFGKVANVNEKLREQIFSTAVYDVERIAYEELVKIYKKIEDKHNIPEEDRLALPKIYGFNSLYGKETVVLEDLTAKGFSVHDRLKSVDWPYASKAIELLAKFHALSMVYAEEYPDSFQEHCEKLSSLLSNLHDGFKIGFGMFLTMCLAAVKEENKAKLKAFFDKRELVEYTQMYKTAVQKPVLVHTDYKQSNLMHRYNEDGSIEMVLIDLQTIQPSSPVMDLLNFVITGTDAAFRKEYWSKLLDHYYATLSRLLKAYGLNPDKIYSRETFDSELQQRLPYGLMIAVITLPVVTMEGQDAPNQSEDISIEDFDFKLGSTFPDRINGIVDDFVRWGIL